MKHGPKLLITQKIGTLSPQLRAPLQFMLFYNLVASSDGGFDLVPASDMANQTVLSASPSVSRGPAAELFQFIRLGRARS